MTTIRAYTFQPFPPIAGLPHRPLDRRARPRPRGEPEPLLLTQRVRSQLHHARRAILLVAGLLAPITAATTIPAFGATGGLTFAQWITGASDGTIDIPLPPAMPVDLVASTRGNRGAMHLEGRAAETINASLPFSNAPIEAARPFLLAAAASQGDQSRALHCLSQAVYYEAAHEPVDGRRAVAQVVLNRVRHPAFPNSVCGVVYDGSTRPGCQFSFTCDGSLRRQPVGRAWIEAQQIAREALQGRIAGAVGTATHYHANYVSPYWAPRLTKLAQIGAHIFYRWPGNWGRGGAFVSRYAGVEAIGTPSMPVVPALLAQVEAQMPAPDPTDRRAPQDIGGRLDVTKGWTLTIPAADESRSALSSVVDRQAPAAPAQPAARQP